jgi:hypothetical protein
MARPAKYPAEGWRSAHVARPGSAAVHAKSLRFVRLPHTWHELRRKSSTQGWRRPRLGARTCHFLPADALQLPQLRQARGRGASTDTTRTRLVIISRNQHMSLPRHADDHASSFIRSAMGCPVSPPRRIRTEDPGLTRGASCSGRNRRRNGFAACSIRIVRVRRRRSCRHRPGVASGRHGRAVRRQR